MEGAAMSEHVIEAGGTGQHLRSGRGRRLFGLSALWSRPGAEKEALPARLELRRKWPGRFPTPLAAVSSKPRVRRVRGVRAGSSGIYDDTDFALCKGGL